MVDAAPKQDEFNWRLPVYAALGAVVFFLPIATFAFDIGLLLYTLVAVPITCLILLGVAAVIAFYKNWLRSLAVFSMLLVYCAVSWGLFKNSLELHTAAKWLLFSKKYESEVLAQPVPRAGDYRHIEWDGWGFAGNETTMYLVFDPSDSLSSAMKSHPTGKLDRILCGVSRIQRLRKQWYSVEFFTDTGWADCGPAPAN